MILASGSPRRKQILSLMGFDFDVIVPDGIDEKSYLNIENLNESLCNLAQIKAMSVANSFPAAIVLGADTIVVKDKHVLGKPEDKQDAFKMLRLLSGSMHTVTTGISLVCNECGFIGVKTVSTRVFFRSIPDQEIEMYLNVNPDYMDKAGAYAIQGKALIFIEKIEGCYYNVVGLPVIGTIDLFKDFTVRKESADV